MIELTARQKQVLVKIVVGKTNAEIAQELCLTEKTVKSMTTKIYTKLDVRNRVEAAMKALLDSIPPEEIVERIVGGRRT